MNDNSIPKAPTDPMVAIWVGIGLSVVGGVVSAIEEVQAFGILLAGIGGLFVLVGAVGQGVLMALRVSRYEVDVQRIIDDGAE